MFGTCFLYAQSRSQLPAWWAQNGGGIPYVMFFIAFFCTLIPKPGLLFRIAVAVTLATCALELLQLWQPPWLTAIRSTKLGAALLGTTFVLSDIPPYFMGGFAGYVMLRVAWRLCPKQ